MDDNLDCWEDLSFCFWVVPVGIFVSFIALGCCCGFCFGCMDSVDKDEEDETQEDSTIK